MNAQTGWFPKSVLHAIFELHPWLCEPWKTWGYTTNQWPHIERLFVNSVNDTWGTSVVHLSKNDADTKLQHSSLLLRSETIWNDFHGLALHCNPQLRTMDMILSGKSVNIILRYFEHTLLLYFNSCSYYIDPVGNKFSKMLLDTKWYKMVQYM